MIEKLTDNVEIHQTLGDNPNTDGEGMTADELKKAFDRPARLIKEYINNILLASVLDKNGDELKGALNAGGFRITNLPEPVGDSDAVTKAFLAGFVAANALTKDGGKMTGALTLRGIYLTEGEDYFSSLPENVPDGKLIFVEAGE